MAERLVRQPADVERLRVARALGVSPRRFLGWEPTERHDHYDAAGTLTGTTIVTREAEWDDDQRGQMLALGRYEAGVCACGFHSTLTHDKANRFTFEDDLCPVCEGADRYARIQHAADDQQREQTKRVLGIQGDAPLPPATPDPADGRHTSTRLIPESEAQQK